MGHLDSSSERRAYAAHFYRLFGAWRVEWTKSKKSVSDLGLGFVAIAKRRTYCCDTDDRQPTGSVLVVRNGSPGRKILRRFCL